MKRNVEELAALSRLLDEALELPAEARLQWVEQLTDPFTQLRPSLRQLLSVHSHWETGEVAGFSKHVEAALQEAVAAPEGALPLAGTQVGPYRLIREIGLGGMGSVWLAERADGSFRRSVALKLLHATWIGGAGERMARERDILAGLEHPNIARFYDAGVDDSGRPFLALEFVEGVPIDAYCREHALPVEDRLRLVLDVAKAVGYAHSRLVVHRDLKPSNILVTRDGAVRLLDFGIAKLLDDPAGQADSLTKLAGRLMTPDFASPEQIRGESVGTATDVYSLAVVTYELLTGARPYKLRHSSLAELEQAIVDADPIRASAATTDPALRRRLRGDLDAILNRAMKKNPTDRYSSVEAFAGDLQRHLDHEAVVARPDRAAYRLRKFMIRRRVPLAFAATLFVAVVAGATVSLRQATLARQQADRAEQVKRFALSMFDGASIEGGGNQQTTARQLLAQARSRLDHELSVQPAMAVEMLSTIGSAYLGLGEEALGIEALREAVARGDRALGAAHPLSLGARARLAMALALSGEINDAEPLSSAAVAGLGRAPRVDGEGLMTAWIVRGIVAFEHGRKLDGLAAMRNAVRVADEDLPASDRLNRVNARVNLVNALQAAGDPTANAVAKQTYDMARAAFGDELAPMMLQARFFYADTLPAERAADAIGELEATLAQMRQALGPQHFMISGVLQSLGEKRPAVGDTRGAVEAMRAYRDMEDSLQGDKPTYARAFARLRLGVALLQDGRSREAVAEMRSAPNMLQQALGTTDQHMVDTARMRLAWALAEAGDVPGADAALRPVKDLETASVQGGTGRDLLLVARVRQLQGRSAESERLLQVALEQLGKNGQAADYDRIRLQQAFTWVDAGKPAEALPVLQAAWSRMRAQQTVDSPPLAEVALALGRAQRATLDLTGAERSLRWVGDFWLRYDRTHRMRGVAAAELAQVLDARADGKGANALRLLAAPLLNADPRPGDRELLRPATGRTNRYPAG
jgi:serine/threonine-protein kinase